MIEKCLLCDKSDIENLSPTAEELVKLEAWECPRCGLVKISTNLALAINNYTKEEKWLLSAYFREKSAHNVPYDAIEASEISDILKNMRRRKPQGLVDAQYGFIIFMGSKSDLLGSWLLYDYNSDLDLMMAEAEIEYIASTLLDQKLIEYKSKQRLAMHRVDLHDTNGSDIPFRQLYKFNHPIYLRLTADGRKKYEELLSQGYKSNKVFVAMWYSEETKKLREALKAGIEAAGYDPIIADEGDFTGNVMDFVIGSIRQSKFVIADFTAAPEKSVNENGSKRIMGGVRGGVYYEAGFAKGLGLEVIHTCKDDEPSKQRIHFDIEQDNTIFWNEADLKTTTVRSIEQRTTSSAAMNFAEKIHDRIISIFGFGPLIEEN